MSGLDHPVCLVQNEEIERFYIIRQLAFLSPNQKCLIECRGLHTSCIMSQSRPGVATSTSTPRDSIRFCFWGDIPPTMAATLTRGGALGTFGSFEVTRSSGALTPFRQAFKCDDIWSASSRVGARINARTGLRIFEAGRFLHERSLCRTGNPYARVFPEPCANVGV